MADYSVDIIDTVVEEEVITKWGYMYRPEPIEVCKCLIVTEPSDQVVVSPRKLQILSTVTRTEQYLRGRRIPELIRFLLTHVIASGSSHPATFLKTLLDDCMLFRAGHGQPPVLYEERHLQAVVKSFDPGNRGWLSSGQVRRAFITLGLTPDEFLPERMPVSEVLQKLQETQEYELLKLLSAGTSFQDDDEGSINKNSYSSINSRVIKTKQV